MLNKASSLALTFIIFFAPFALGTVHLWSQTVLGIAVIILFFLCALKVVEDGRARRKASIVSLSFIALFLFACLQIYFKITNYPYRTYRAGELGLIYFALFAATCYFLRERKDVESAFLKITLAGFVASVLGIAQLLTGTDRIYWLFGFPGAAPFGPFIYENHFACYASMTALVTVGGIVFAGKGDKAIDWRYPLKISLVKFFNDPRNGKMFFKGFALIVIISAVFLSRSRAGILILTAAFILFFSFMLLTKHKEKVVWVFIIGVLTAVLLVSWIGIDRTMKDLQTLFSYEGYGGRVGVYGDALKMFKSHPFTGIGIDAFSAVFPSYRSVPASNFYEYLHSDVFQFIVDAGIIGFTLIIIPFAIFLWRLSRAARNLPDRSLRYTALALFSACFYLILHSSLDFCMRSGAVSSLFVMILAIGAAVINIGSRAEESDADFIKINLYGRKKAALCVFLALIFIYAGALFVKPLLAECIAGRAKTLNDIDRAVSLNPGDDRLSFDRYKMAIGLYKDKKITEDLAYHEAKISIERALELNKHKTKYLLLLGGLELKRGDYYKAESFFKKAMDQEPSNQEIRMLYAYELFKRAINEKNALLREDLLKKGFVYYSTAKSYGVTLKHVAPDDSSYTRVKDAMKKIGLPVM